MEVGRPMKKFDNKQCAGCAWRSGGKKQFLCCVYYLETGKHRIQGEDGKCESYTAGSRPRRDPLSYM